MYGIIPDLDVVSSETVTQRLKRVGDVFRAFWVEHATLQTDEEGEACTMLHASTTRNSKVGKQMLASRMRWVSCAMERPANNHNACSCLFNLQQN